MSASFDRRWTSLTRRELLACGPAAVAGFVAFGEWARAQTGETGFVEVKTTRGAFVAHAATA
jgi:hypothetical protein